MIVAKSQRPCCASNFSIADSHLKHIRGQGKPKSTPDALHPKELWKSYQTTFLQLEANPFRTENLKTFSEAKTIGSGKLMTNYFCSTCGTLMYRIGEAFKGENFLRIGTVDDFSLHETKLRPQVEQFIKDRVSWVHGVDGAKKFEGMGS